jgi:hypothetical protein
MRVTSIAAFVLTSSLAASAQGQFVKGNQAVSIGKDGGQRVETPPLPGATLGPPCRANKPGCTGRGWLMVETQAGIQECTELYARPGTCRASTFGTEKRPRLWVVKLNGEWMQCQRPNLASKCISIKVLPTSIVQ